MSPKRLRGWDQAAALSPPLSRSWTDWPGDTCSEANKSASWFSHLCLTHTQFWNSCTSPVQGSLSHSYNATFAVLCWGNLCGTLVLQAINVAWQTWKSASGSSINRAIMKARPVEFIRAGIRKLEQCLTFLPGRIFVYLFVF